MVFRAALSALFLLCTLEYARLANLRRAGTAALIIIQAVIFLLLFNNWEVVRELSVSFLTAASLTWCLMFLRLVTFRAGMGPQCGYSILGFAMALASMTVVWLAFAVIRDQAHGQIWILCFLLIVWAADIGAYFSGRHFGGAKLAPGISPSKTWAGFFGGLASSMAVGAAIALLIPQVSLSPLVVACLAVPTMLASVGGDLLISIQKRILGLKDTGNILPGHGGLLDRLDSTIAAAPFFALGLLIAGT